MNPLLVGYARVSTEHQDLTAKRNSLAALGVGNDRIYVDHGLTGTNRDRPGAAKVATKARVLRCVQELASEATVSCSTAGSLSLFRLSVSTVDDGCSRPPRW